MNVIKTVSLLKKFVFLFYNLRTSQQLLTQLNYLPPRTCRFARITLISSAVKEV